MSKFCLDSRLRYAAFLSFIFTTILQFSKKVIKWLWLVTWLFYFWEKVMTRDFDFSEKNIFAVTRDLTFWLFFEKIRDSWLWLLTRALRKWLTLTVPGCNQVKTNQVATRLIKFGYFTTWLDWAEPGLTRVAAEQSEAKNLGKKCVFWPKNVYSIENCVFLTLKNA